MWTNKEEHLGCQITKPKTPTLEKKASKPLAVKTCEAVVVGETPSLTGESIGETHRVLERMQTHPLGNQHQKGPICLWVAREVTESHSRGASGIVPSHTPPPHKAPQHSYVDCLKLVNN